MSETYFNLQLTEDASGGIPDFIMGDITSYYFSDGMLHIHLQQVRAGQKPEQIDVSISTKFVDFITMKRGE